MIKKIVRCLSLPVLYVFIFMTLWANSLSVALAAKHDVGAPSQIQKNVVAGVPRIWPPQHSIDKDGNPNGFAIDVMSAVAAEAGLNVTYRVFDNFPGAVNALTRGEVDLLPNIGIVAKRLKTMAFTAPVETFVVSIFVRDETNDLLGEHDLIGRTLGVVKANTGLFLFGERKDIDVQVYPDVRSALFELLAGQVDAIVYPQSVFRALAIEAGIEDRIKVVGNPLKEIKRGIAVKKGNDALLAVLDKAVEGYVGTPEYQQVYAKWYGKSRPFWTTPRVLGLIAGFVILTLFAAGGWHYLSVVRWNAALTSSETRLADILNIAPEGVITVNEDMIINLFNKGAERIFGYQSGEMNGQPLERLMPQRSRNRHASHVEEFKRSGDEYRLMDRRQEIVGLRKDGTEFPASASVSKLQTNNESLYTVVIHDISERKQTEKTLIAAKGEAETASHAKSQFLAAVSHELRTPLNAIIGFAQILEGQLLGPIGEKKYQEYAKDIGNSGELLLALVDDLLDISTIEAGKQSLVKETLSTKEIVASCVKIVVEKARIAGINISATTPDDLPPLHADLRATKQILLNLLSNAIKFTSKGGKITVSASASKENTTIRITDTGKGIPADKLPELTNMFVRAEQDPHLAEKGWGLGLSITKSLIDLHDGKLDIKSKVGEGTSVTVTLPNITT